MSAVVSAPPRPDRPASGPAPRRFLPVAVLTAVVAFVSLGGYAVAAVLATPQGPPTGFPDIVRVQPLSGWTVQRELDDSGSPFIRLTRGTGTLDVHVVLRADGPASLARTYVDRALTEDLSRVRISDRLERVELGGVVAVRFQYLGVLGGSGTSVEGQVTAAVTSSGDGVVFDGRAPQGLLPFVRGDLDTMISRAEIGP